MLEKIFHLKENHTDVKTELMAGVTTFMTMAYILAVNPSILSASGMDANAVLIATSLASFVGTALMALLANYPFALAPGEHIVVVKGYFADELQPLTVVPFQDKRRFRRQFLGFYCPEGIFCRQFDSRRV